ncbi:hypothetical protein JYT28_01475 [Desulfobulbus sp. AH-315-M07]|nr:hypothetical protein [Desulfobulbus sp. AH-315-M07]
MNDKTRELMETLVMGALARHLQAQVEGLYSMVKGINRLLGDLRFGSTRYQFKVTPRSERGELVALVRELSMLNEDSRNRFRVWIDERLGDLKPNRDDEVPEILDYRRWFDYRLTMRSRTGTDPATKDDADAGSTGTGETVMTRELRQLGSGGEQGVPNYLLVLALAKLMFDNAKARVRPLLFDEAFYGIDAGRRDELLRFATQLGLQLFVASPDQDGVTPAVRHATTLFLVKDAEGDVHLAPYHYWNRRDVTQRSLFDRTPDEPPAEEARCIVAEAQQLPRSSGD